MKMEPLRLVVLGATGFVGRAVMRRLAELPAQAVEVRALVRNQASTLDAPFVQQVHGDIVDIPESLFFDAPHAVLHLATVQRGKDFSTNERGAASLAARLPEPCRAVVYGSSCSVYGFGSQRGFSESASLHAETTLAASRRKSEQILFDAGQDRGMSVFAMRPRMIVGTGDRYTLPRLVDLARKRVTLGTGLQRHTLVDVDDYAESLIRVASNAIERGRQSRQCALNVGYRRPISSNEIAEIVCQEFGIPPARFRLPVAETALRWARYSPLAGLSTTLSLGSLDHFVNVDALQAEVGADLVERDPRVTVRCAAQAIFQQEQARD